MPCSGCGGSPTAGMTSAEVAELQAENKRFAVTVNGDTTWFATYQEANTFKATNGGQLTAI